MNVKSKRQKISTKGLLCELNKDILNKTDKNAQVRILRSGASKGLNQSIYERKNEVKLVGIKKTRSVKAALKDRETNVTGNLNIRNVDCVQKKCEEEVRKNSDKGIVFVSEERWAEVHDLWNSNIENVNWDELNWN